MPACLTLIEKDVLELADLLTRSQGLYNLALQLMEMNCEILNLSTLNPEPYAPNPSTPNPKPLRL